MEVLITVTASWECPKQLGSAQVWSIHVKSAISGYNWLSSRLVSLHTGLWWVMGSALHWKWFVREGERSQDDSDSDNEPPYDYPRYDGLVSITVDR